MSTCAFDCPFCGAHLPDEDMSEHVEYWHYGEER
jgi:hypothetical protein